MPGLLLALLAMVAIVSAAQARPSAPASAASDVRDLGDSIEQIHPAPFRSISKERFEADVSELASRAPRISRDELLVGILRLIRESGVTLVTRISGLLLSAIAVQLVADAVRAFIAGEG